MKPLIIFHANCPDGTGAALAAWLTFGTQAHYVAAKHGDDFVGVDDVRGRDVWFLDFTYDPATIDVLAEAAESIHIVDHHQSAFDKFEGRVTPSNVNVEIDTDYSGAVLAWRKLHPYKPVPRLFELIQDRDLWRHEFDDTPAAHAGLVALGFNQPAMWAPYVRHDVLEILLEDGRGLARADAMTRQFILQFAYRIEFEGFPAAVVNSPTHQSDLGAALAKEVDGVGIVWFFDGNLRQFVVSLRSVKGGPDVAKMAEKFGGGGHPSSAGFQVGALSGSLKGASAPL